MARVDSALFFTFRFGLFAFGYYGIGFELSVEATYPIDEGKFGYQLSRAIAIRRYNFWYYCVILILYQYLFTYNIGTGTAFIFFAGQIQGALLLTLSSAFEKELDKEAKLIAVCTKETTPW